MAGQIFRKKSLERLSTPDRLDQLLRIVKRRSWIPLLTLGGLLVFAVVWSVIGRIPMTTNAIAVLVYPSDVKPIQTPASGELVKLEIFVGAKVQAGQVIGVLNRPDLEHQIQLEEQRLAQFEARAATLEGFNEEQTQKQVEFLDGQSRGIKKRIEAVLEKAEAARSQTLDYNKTQRENLETSRTYAERLSKAFLERLESSKALLDKGLAIPDTVIGAEQRWANNQLRLADLKVKVYELDLRKIQAEDAHAKEMDLVADLTMQLEKLKLDIYRAKRRLDEGRIQDQTSKNEIDRTLERLRSSLTNQTQIKAEHSGVVLEVTVSTGSLVRAGQRVASLAVDDPTKELVALAYFPISGGKKIHEGMAVRISPVTVQRQRFGSMLGRVTKVSPYPVTADSVVNQVGNREMAKMLVGQGTVIEVEAELLRDPSAPSGFKWTSADGPPRGTRITTGTTAAVRVTTENRAPITLLMPALRDWLGID